MKSQPKGKRHQKPREAPKSRIVTTETTKVTTQPMVEVRRPATLAQALTERAVAPKVSKTRKVRWVA